MRARTWLRIVSVAKIVAVGVVASAPAQAAGGGLNLIPDKPILATLLIGFVALIFPLNALIFRPLLAVLDSRDERIAGARRRADRLEEETNQILTRYQGSIREAREASEASRREVVDAAREEHQRVTGAARDEALGEIDRARAELGSALETARESLGREARGLAKDISERVLGRAL